MPPTNLADMGGLSMSILLILPGFAGWHVAGTSSRHLWRLLVLTPCVDLASLSWGLLARQRAGADPAPLLHSSAPATLVCVRGTDFLSLTA